MLPARACRVGFFAIVSLTAYSLFSADPACQPIPHAARLVPAFRASSHGRAIQSASPRHPLHVYTAVHQETPGVKLESYCSVSVLPALSMTEKLLLLSTLRQTIVSSYQLN